MKPPEWLVRLPYQGTTLMAESISYINTARGYGTDTLYRTQAGQYYLQRFSAPRDGGFTAVHRISVVAAALWCLSLGANDFRLHLYRDAQRLFCAAVRKEAA